MASEPLAEIVDVEETGLAVREHAPVTLFGTDDPIAVIEQATRVAKALADVVNERKLYSTISGKKHVRVEGWQLLGSMLGIYPITEWTRTCTDSKGAEGWEARVIAQRQDGSVVGTREAMCTRSEGRWKNADDYAIRSMAQTRAVSGALSMPLRFVMELAGYSGTPEAEIPQHQEERPVETEKVTVPRTWEAIIDRAKELLGADEAAEWLGQAKELKEMSALTPEPSLFQRLAAAIADLTKAGHDYQLMHGSRKVVRDILAARLDGNLLDGPEWCLDGEDADELLRPSKEEVLTRGAA